jgi:hypothetical protein
VAIRSGSMHIPLDAVFHDPDASVAGRYVKFCRVGAAVSPPKSPDRSCLGVSKLGRDVGVRNQRRTVRDSGEAPLLHIWLTDDAFAVKEWRDEIR